MPRIPIAPLALGLMLAPPALAQDAPFGTGTDTAYAAELWTAMTELRLAGPGMIRAAPYPGTEPHGLMLETFYTTLEMDGHEGALVVKRNYGPEGVSATAVLEAPDEHLASVTVMVRREEGYDPDNANWFWAKYLPDGSLDTNPAGRALAGRVAKGADRGCIACHSREDDYLFTTDALPE